MIIGRREMSVEKTFMLEIFPHLDIGETRYVI